MFILAIQLGSFTTDLLPRNTFSKSRTVISFFSRRNKTTRRRGAIKKSRALIQARLRVGEIYSRLAVPYFVFPTRIMPENLDPVNMGIFCHDATARGCRRSDAQFFQAGLPGVD
jgi:hypothetical protein